MIVGSSLTIEIGDRTLLRDASFVVGAGEKVGLVGRNGSGKSTFISVVIGEPAGNVRSSGNARIRGTYGYLPQVPVPQGLGLEPNGFSHILSARGLDVLDDALGKARSQMAKDPSSENIELFSDLEEQFRENGGYEAESTMARLADGLGLRQEALLDDIDGLSGGQRRRVDLIRILFQGPDTMILDEPTNHLDLPAKRWLMEELESFPGAILVVSHDLKLLDRSINKVLHLADSTLHEFKGTYSSYLAQFEADTAQRERAAELEGREIKRLSTLADSMRGSTNRRARIAKSIDKRVDRLESSRTTVRQRERTAVFRLPRPERSSGIPIQVERLGVRYGSLTALGAVDLQVTRGDRIVVIGKNGAGKSSLLRCLAGVQEPSTGSVTLGKHVTLGYFAQEHEQVDPDVTVLDNIDDTVLTTETERRALLGSFGLAGKVAHQMPATLSGGERAKLGLAMLAAGRANVLLLDEPTNNLDPASIHAVGAMLSRWDGTIVVVSHDRSFVSALEPTHCLRLPDEVFTHWNEAYLDQVEAK
ncbi:MAG: ABC-F family ATP-binding cassette domain-containing protein [Actinomycetota bacterium]|jgi:ATPase subunit of ABC transporter with duplicated ATPase domains|nr:ABC-F family ATP-binding cassette domain-containing protein [Actinomycetota bacterium]